jgi:DHA2 family multidrug resistance protein
MASTAEQNEAPETAPPEINPWLVAGTVMLATFMQVLDTSVANVSLPYIVGSLSADIDESTWVLTSYLVSNGIILPLSGWLASVFGRKRVFLASVGLFTLSSFLCGIYISLTMLIFFRILQGAGGGAMQPIAQAILVESSPVERRGTAMAIFGMGVTVAPIIGPTLGGYLTSNFSWRWTFLINVPVGVIVVFPATRFVFDPPWLMWERGARRYIDYIGLGVVALGLGCLHIVLDGGQRKDWFSSRFIVVLAITAAVSLVVFVVWELTHREPVVDLRLLGERNVAVAVVTMFMLGLVLYGSIALLPVFLQTLMGYTAYLSGLVLSPGGILTLILMPIVGWLVPCIHPRYMVAVGLIIMAWSLFYMAGFKLQVSFWDAVIARAIQGAGLAFFFVPVNAVAFHYIPRQKTNDAASGICTFVS